MTDYAALMRKIAEDFPLPAPERAIPTGAGIWSAEFIEEMLAAWKEHWEDKFEFESTSRRGGWRISCPGNTPGGWPDGAEHGEKYHRLNDSTIVYIDSGWPCFSCRHYHCADGAEHGRKSFRHLLDYYDPERKLCNYPRIDSMEVLRDMEARKDSMFLLREATE
jgi:hypothetical protein